MHDESPELERLQDELMSLRREYEQFRGWVPGALLEINLTTLRVDYMNDVARSILGYDPEDVAAGILGPALVDPATMHLFARETERWLRPSRETGEAHERVHGQVLYEGTMVRKDGSRFPVEVQGSFRLDGAGQAVGLWIAFRDISTRRQLEHTSRQQSELLRHATDSTPIVLWAVNRELHLTFLQGSGLSRLGIDPDLRPSGQHVDDIFGHLPDVAEGCEISRDGDARTFAIDWRGVTFEVHTAPLRGAEGNVTGVIGIATDTTLRREAEETAFQSRKAESLAFLAGGMAHQFNNLLMGILGNAHLVLLANDNLSPAIASLVENIEVSARQAAKLTRNMLAYAGTDRFVRRPVDVAAFLEQAEPTLQAACAPGVSLTAHANPDLPPMHADAQELEQALSNLVENASEAMAGRASGQVTITASMRDFSQTELEATRLADNVRQGLFVVIEVRDNGEGIPPGNISQIFDPFFSTRFTGRGLGLAAVFGIVRAHEGTIMVDSQPGRGTAIRLLIPVAPTELVGT